MAHLAIYGGLLPATLTGPIRRGLTDPSPGCDLLGIEPTLSTSSAEPLSAVLSALRLRAGQADSLSAAIFITAVNLSRAVQPSAELAERRRLAFLKVWRVGKKNVYSKSYF